VYLLYSLLLTTFSLLALPFYLWKDRVSGKYRRSFRERMGRVPPGLNPEGRPAVWIHAVSVGEVIASRPLVAALEARLSEHRLLLSTTTVTGQAVARQDHGGADDVFYAPFDWAGPVRKALDAVRPSLIVLVETEIWPNLIHEARRRGIRIALVNGRISPRSFPRYRLLRPFFRRVLSQMDLFLMQGEVHAQRIAAMGAPSDRVRVLGNLKFDALPDPDAGDLARLLDPGRPLWVAGSTVNGEEKEVLEVLREIRQKLGDVRLLLAPRHPERFDQAYSVVVQAGFRCARRSVLGSPWGQEEVLLLDSLGELARVYALATVVFVGGSLMPSGGHNVLEAAVAGKAIVVGPHMENFQEIADQFLAEGALVQVASAEGLARETLALLADPEKRSEVGKRARDLVHRSRGAVEKTVDALARLL
jgi:3-deoxy-D-manno-octulosonic-acid transferase